MTIPTPRPRELVFEPAWFAVRRVVEGSYLGANLLSFRDWRLGVEVIGAERESRATTRVRDRGWKGSGPGTNLELITTAPSSRVTPLYPTITRPMMRGWSYG